jgi:hypothetical protein
MKSAGGTRDNITRLVIPRVPQETEGAFCSAPEDRPSLVPPTTYLLSPMTTCCLPRLSAGSHDYLPPSHDYLLYPTIPTAHQGMAVRFQWLQEKMITRQERCHGREAGKGRKLRQRVSSVSTPHQLSITGRRSKRGY